MNNFRGSHRRSAYFEGWYMKHQKEDISIAFIPAFHVSNRGERAASIQVVTKEGTWNFPFKGKEFYAAKRHFYVKIGSNIFSDKGIRVALKNEAVEITGVLRYQPFTELYSDIMGPFRFLPFMQCSHGILSMIHGISGMLTINGKVYDFSGGTGYIEKDFGSSFPRDYTWTQCGDWTGKKDSSLVACAAHIPFGLFSFAGCICAIWYGGIEYRLATYLGARIIKNTENELIIKQGRYRLEVYRSLLDREKKKPGTSYIEGLLLYAPEYGSMSRRIKETITCTVRYRFMDSGKIIFDFVSHRASYEYVS
ncbi:tocopherol cyclase family protein [Kineothrix sp. MB12-C1]|uniref:tocopherol cyclase family protein n=1 Tax=Kineothrix sp. MB12-C1 TaxID=3070215 RepID=UPI0027D1F104|nr:tocopherol cyclase family protein [Kineothrix sp. MB12-C1]WMC94362.1 tocopherol cyclase family protein [Kineothrix sp. MB12-C1]